MHSTDFTEWLRIGFEAGYCGPPVCATHNLVPMTEAEETDADNGDEPCVQVIRIYDDAAMKAAVEAHHSASTWSAHNWGLTTQAQP